MVEFSSTRKEEDGGREGSSKPGEKLAVNWLAYLAYDTSAGGGGSGWWRWRGIGDWTDLQRKNRDDGAVVRHPEEIGGGDGWDQPHPSKRDV